MKTVIKFLYSSHPWGLSCTCKLGGRKMHEYLWELLFPCETRCPECVSTVRTAVYPWGLSPRDTWVPVRTVVYIWDLAYMTYENCLHMRETASGSCLRTYETLLIYLLRRTVPESCTRTLVYLCMTTCENGVYLWYLLSKKDDHIDHPWKESFTCYLWSLFPKDVRVQVLVTTLIHLWEQILTMYK